MARNGSAAQKNKVPPLGESDVYQYFGEVAREGYLRLTECLKPLPRKESASLVLATYGGDADAAFRMGRAFRHHYKKLTIIVPGYCKSAGSLMCVAANELVVCDLGELGPLDVQVMKRDEMFEQSSGLDITQALDVIQQRTMDAFRDYLIEIRRGTGISTKIASDLASKLALGLYTPINDQIDPVRLGEMQRAVLVAHKYGQMLNAYHRNVRPGGLEKLITEYPSHSFVIDRKECREIFVNVREPTDEECALCGTLYNANTNLFSLQVQRLVQNAPTQQPQAKPDAAVTAESPGSA